MKLLFRIIFGPLFRCKHLACALLTITLVVCGTEIGLRVYDSYTGRWTGGHLYDEGLICKSWTTHHALKPLQNTTQLHPDTHKPVTIRTNSLGLRGDAVAVPKPPGLFRIICLGDERTAGFEVPEEQTFSVLLQKQLQQLTRLQVEVVNAGVPGYCPLLSFLQLKQSLIALEPDLVILNFDMSDVADDYRYRGFTMMHGRNELLCCAHPDLQVPTPEQQANAFLLPLVAMRTTATLWSENMPATGVPSIELATGTYLWLRDRPPDWSIHIEQAFPADPANETIDAGRLRGFCAGCSARSVASLNERGSRRRCSWGSRRQRQHRLPQQAAVRVARALHHRTRDCPVRHVCRVSISPGLTQSVLPQRNRPLPRRPRTLRPRTGQVHPPAHRRHLEFRAVPPHATRSPNRRSS